MLLRKSLIIGSNHINSSLPSCSQPIKDFLDEARIEMKGRTNAWVISHITQGFIVTVSKARPKSPKIPPPPNSPP